jgi:acid phosphatase (class A)
MLRLAFLLLLSVAPAAAVVAQPAVAHATKKFELLDSAAFAPVQLLPAPAPTGSPAEALELAQLRQLIAATSAERMAQAKWDDAHEDPAIFDAIVGRQLSTLPATWALLLTVQNEGDMAANLSKEYFARVRPWGADPTLPNCDAGKGKKPTRGYPSGHATLGYSVGWALAQLMPGKAAAILSRAHDYALSREICGVHFHSDTEASHVIGTLVASRLFADPRLASRIAAARAELATN